MKKYFTKKITNSVMDTRNLPRNTKHIPSIDMGIGNAVKKDIPVYTGTNLVGIATMHKSNAVPVFNTEAAKDISEMRR